MSEIGGSTQRFTFSEETRSNVLTCSLKLNVFLLCRCLVWVHFKITKTRYYAMYFVNCINGFF